MPENKFARVMIVGMSYKSLEGGYNGAQPGNISFLCAPVTKNEDGYKISDKSLAFEISGDRIFANDQTLGAIAYSRLKDVPVIVPESIVSHSLMASEMRDNTIMVREQWTFSEIRSMLADSAFFEGRDVPDKAVYDFGEEMSDRVAGAADDCCQNVAGILSEFAEEKNGVSMSGT